MSDVDMNSSDSDATVIEQTATAASTATSTGAATSACSSRDDLTPSESLELMKAYFDSKLGSITASLKRPKEKEKFKFKSKANEIQSDYNRDLLDSVEELKGLILKRGSKKRQLDCILDLESKINKRSKLIKIADTSPAGWDTMNQYEAERIGDDSEDERRIKAAERRALAKRKERVASLRTEQDKRKAAYPRNNVKRTSFTNKVAKHQDLCLRCHKPGHWKKDCRVKFGEGKESQRYEDYFNCVKTPNVKGKVEEKVKFWEEELKANYVVLDTIKNGHKLQFEKLPESRKFKNNISALKNQKFVETEIENLLQSKRVLEVSEAPFIVNPLTVAQNSDESLRLILDLRYVNEHLEKEYVRYDDWRVFGEYLEENAWCFKFDLKSGYHHFDIHKGYYKYLGFSWVIDGAIRYFVFTVLVFGLSSAARVFTKMLRPLSTYFRDLGIKIAFYLDDGASTAKTKLIAEENARFVLNTLERAGLMVNFEKSVWEPVQKLTWLGINVNTIEGVYTITERRIEKCIAHLESILLSPVVSAQKLAKIVGCLVSMHFVLGDIVILRTRAMNTIITSLPTWDTKINIKNCTYTTHEIQFWLKNIKSLNSREMIYLEHVPDYVVHSDASNCAIGIIVNDIKCHRSLSETEKSQSSTARELIAVLHGLENLKSIFTNKKVLWNVDNYSATCIIRRGSSKQCLQDIATKLYEICMIKNISLKVKWIPREFNYTADLLSKYVDIDNWEISRETFETLDKAWGPFTIDRFANARNSKVNRFNSRFFEKDSHGVDAFQFDWGIEVNYLVPPISLVSKTIKKCVKDQAQGALITPLWRSADFWPLLKKGSGWGDFVLDTKIFPFHEAVQDVGHQDLSWTKLGKNDTQMIAIKIGFN